MRQLVNIFFICLALAGHGQVMWQLKNGEVKKWYYTGGDEFNESYVDWNKWRYNAFWGGALPKQRAVFTPDNVYQAEGAVHLVVKKEHIKARIYPWEIDSSWARKNNVQVENEMMWFDYTLGQLFSQIRYKYGYFECRFKANEEKGTWPAFWLFAGEPNNEIDWFEIKGERKKQFHVDVHCPNGCENYRGGFLNLGYNWGGWLKTDRSLAEGYNVIAGEWDPEYITWYLNGKPIAWFKHHFDIGMWLIIGTGLAADNEAFGPGPDKTTKFPNEVMVDYVRVWGTQDTARKNMESFIASEQTIKETDAVHTSKLKKVLKFIYNKKALKNDKGYVTLLPAGYMAYSLTFNCAPVNEAKVEIMGKDGKKVKEFAISKPTYYKMDLSDLDNGTYTLNVFIHGKTLTSDLVLQKPYRK